MRARSMLMLALATILATIIAVSGNYAIIVSAQSMQSSEISNTVNTTFIPPILITKVINDTTPELNFLNKSSPYYGKITINESPSSRKIPSPRIDATNSRLTVSPNTVVDGAVYGTWINANSNLYGVYAQQQIQPNLNLYNPGYSDLRLYAPCLESVNGNPLESVMVYEKNNPTTTTRWLGVWLHTDGTERRGFVYTKVVDSTFINNYVYTIGNNQYYFTKIIKMGNTYIVYLYNNRLLSWENIYQTTDSWSRTDGWDYWENKFQGVPETLPQIESTTISVFHNNGNTYYVTPSYGWLANDPNSGIQQTYHANMISQYYHWSVSS